MAAWQLGKKIPEILLRLVGFGDLVLQQVGESPDYILRQRATVVTPSPDGHFADLEVFGSGAIAPKQ